MKSNVGKPERIVRIVAALVLLAMGAGWWWGFYGLAGLMFITAMVAWCPLRAILGRSSCRETEEETIPADTSGSDRDARFRERRFK